MTNLFRRCLLAMAAAGLLAGCASNNIERYTSEKPALDLAQYFQGKTIGHGMVTDRSGAVIRRFVVRIDGQFSGNTGVLDEHFDWSDGEKERRVWRLEKAGPQQWIGRADDVDGVANGEVRGNSLRWGYVLNLKTKDGSVYKIDFDDWMHLIDPEGRVLMNRAIFSKFGIHLGEVIISFQKL